jgi:hypothetical protein
MRSSLFEVFTVSSWCDEGKSRGWCFWSKVLTLMCWGTKLRQNGSLPGTLWKAESWSSPASGQQRDRINPCCALRVLYDICLTQSLRTMTLG